MQPADLHRLLPTIEILAQTFPGSSVFVRDPQYTYQGLKLFCPQEALEENILYLLSQEDAPQFPVDTFSYLSLGDIPGQANHICCREGTQRQVLNQALSLFAKLRRQEILLDQLVYQNASLTALCEAGAAMLGNPVYIHDDWFIALAMSSQIDEAMRPEYTMTSARGFLPQAILDDFKYDNEYLETYTHHTPQIWQGEAQLPRSLYVNLWEGSVYRGRLLVLESNRPFQKQDEMLAQFLAQRAMQLMRKRPLPGDDGPSMDNLVYGLLQGQHPDPADLNQMLRSLNWNANDQFCVIRVQNQQESSSAMEHLLHSDLFRAFPKGYVLLSGYQQCLILNLTRQKLTLSEIRHTLSPLCRDYCLYAGIASPVTGIVELHAAYLQAGIALNEAFQLRNEKWILPFSDCALDYWFAHLSGELKSRHLVAPELFVLIRYDEENGTEYFATLREFLLQERSIPRTSEKLIIHRTTLLYRLKKIQSLAPLNLDAPEIRLHLLLSLQILENSRE